MLTATLFLSALLAPGGVPDPSGTTPGATPTDSFAIRATRVHMGGGEVVENGLVLVQDGRIAASGANVTVPEGVPVIEHEGDLSAGMIALHDHSAMRGENLDGTRAVLSEAELAFAVDVGHSDLARLAREGVTSIVVAPGSQALVGGITAVVKTTGRAVKRRAQLDVSLSSASLRAARFPTSYVGAVAELTRRFEGAEGAFADAAAGKLPVLLRVGPRHEVQRAVELATRLKLKGALYGAPRAGELADAIKAANLAVILPPFDPGDDSRGPKSAVQLAAAGVPFGFALDAPARHPASLRLGAAACMRAGLEPSAAWAALTSGAAAIAGVDGSVGSLAPGMDADLVLWSGPPLDLGSSVIAVYVDGKRVFGGDE